MHIGSGPFALTSVRVIPNLYGFGVEVGTREPVVRVCAFVAFQSELEQVIHHKQELSFTHLSRVHSVDDQRMIYFDEPPTDGQLPNQFLEVKMLAEIAVPLIGEIQIESVQMDNIE